MAECAVCGAVIAANEKLCSFCGYHVFAVELLTDPGLSQIQSELGKALRWQFYRQHSYRLHKIAEAEQLIDWFNARDPKELEAQAVTAVVDAGPVEQKSVSKCQQPPVRRTGSRSPASGS